MSSASVDKLNEEHLSKLKLREKILLKIYLVPGMDMLAQESRTGQDFYKNDNANPAEVSPAALPDNADGSSALVRSERIPAPEPLDFPYDQVAVSPQFPSWSPDQTPFVLRRRVSHFEIDGMPSFPVLIIERDRVQFYSNEGELNQFLGEIKNDKILINTAHVVSIQTIVAQEVFSQNITHADIAGGVAQEVPEIQRTPLTFTIDGVFPQISAPEDEFALQLFGAGGQPPYKFNILSGPLDLYVTEDGWLRGFIEAEEWPATGETREFLIRVSIEDSSIPVQTVMFDYRYRLVGT